MPAALQRTHPTFFCNLRLLLLCRAGVDIHGGLNIPMHDPGLDILDIHVLVDQDADTGGPQAVQRQIKTQVVRLKTKHEERHEMHNPIILQV